MNATQRLGFFSDAAATFSGQTYYSTFTVPLTASNQFTVTLGDTLSCVVTTDVSNGSGQVVVASEEDFSDIRAADDAIMEARSKGVRRWEVVKRDLGL